MLWLIDLPLVTRWHVMRIHMAEFTKLELWNAAKCENFSHRLAFPVWRIRMWMNGSQWNEKCSVTAPLLIDWLIDCEISKFLCDLYENVWFVCKSMKHLPKTNLLFHIRLYKDVHMGMYQLATNQNI